VGGWVSDGRVLGLLAISRALGDYDFKGGRDELLRTGEAQGFWTAGEANGRSLSGPAVIATPDVAEVPLTGTSAASDADFLILATDGLWDCCGSARAAAFVRDELKRNGRDADAAAKALVAHALGRRKGQDNVAVVLVLLGADDQAQS
jgi:protein phosphatase 1A